MTRDNTPLDKTSLSDGCKAHQPAIEYGPLNHRIGYALRRAQVAVFQDFFETFSTFKIRPAQYSALTIIEYNPGLTQTQVAEALGIKKGNFVAMIKTLEARKLACRKAIPNDKRSYALFLTDSGKALMDELHKASSQHEERMRSMFGPHYYDAMLPQLRQLGSSNGPVRKMGEAKSET